MSITMKPSLGCVVPPASGKRRPSTERTPGATAGKEAGGDEGDVARPPDRCHDLPGAVTHDHHERRRAESP
jgi:hypothetical protein